MLVRYQLVVTVILCCNCHIPISCNCHIPISCNCRILCCC